MNGKLDLYPQMYPFQQQLRVGCSGRNKEGSVSKVQSLTHSRNYALGSSQSLRVAAVSASQSSGGLPRPSIFSNTA